MSLLILWKSTGGFLSIAMFLHLLLIRQDLEHPALHFTLSHLTSNGRSTGEHTSDSIAPKPHEPPPKKGSTLNFRSVSKPLTSIVRQEKWESRFKKNDSPESKTFIISCGHIWDVFVGLISNSQDSCPLRWYFVSFTRISTEKASPETSKHRLKFLLRWLIHGQMVAPIRRYTWKKTIL